MKNYIVNELPNFTLVDNKLNIDKKVDAYDEEYNFRLFIDTDSNISDETIQKYRTKIYSGEYGLILLEKKAILMYDESILFDDTYETLKNNFDVNINNKNELLDLFQGSNYTLTMILNYILITLGTFLIKFISSLLDLVMLAIVGYFVALYCRIRFKWQAPAILAVYSLTLSIVLSAIYSVIYRFTGFEIKYFDTMYWLISYVYIIASIFMIRTDIIKDATELQKIIEEQEKEKNSQENLDEKNDEEKQNKEEKDKEEENNNNDESDENPDINNREPDGSEI